MNAPRRECADCGMPLQTCFVRHAHIGRRCCIKCEHIVKEINPS